MKNFGTIVAALVVVFVLVAYMCTFQVRFTEVAILKTWGKPAEETLDQPRLYFKIPVMQKEVVFDKRVRILDKRTEETRTHDGKNVLLSTFTLWRISNPIVFDTSFPGGIEEGEKKLRTTVETEAQAIVGKRSFEEFISTNPERRRLREIELAMGAAVAQAVEKEFGVEIIDFGIKKLGLPQAITTSIFSSMKANEESRAATYLAEGDAEAKGIVAAARATEQRIIAAARSKVAQIEAEAQREMSAYYKEFNVHPELRIFLDKLRTVAEALRQRTTLILDTQESPWDVFDKDVRAGIPHSNRGGKGTRSSRDTESKVAKQTD